MKGLESHIFGRLGLSRFLQWRPNTILMRWLPRTMMRSYIGLLGKLYFAINSRERENIKRNLCAVLRRVAGKDSLDLIIRRTFAGISDHYYEKLFIAYHHFGKARRFLDTHVAIPNLKLLDEALCQGKGVILVTGHFGAIECFPLTLAVKGYPVTMVVRFKTHRLKRALTERGASVGITLLDFNEGEGIAFKAIKALKSNQILIVMCDEFEVWRPYRDRHTRFLGCFSPLDRTLDVFKRRYDSPVLMGLFNRGNRDSYVVDLHSLENGQYDGEDSPISERALRVLERYIIRTPEQWYQWKDVRIVLGTKISEETRPIYATEADRSLPGADSVSRTF